MNILGHCWFCRHFIDLKILVIVFDLLKTVNIYASAMIFIVPDLTILILVVISISNRVIVTVSVDKCDSAAFLSFV